MAALAVAVPDQALPGLAIHLLQVPHRGLTAALDCRPLISPEREAVAHRQQGLIIPQVQAALVEQERHHLSLVRRLLMLVAAVEVRIPVLEAQAALAAVEQVADQEAAQVQQAPLI